MTWLIGTIISEYDADTFDVRVERTGGPYASAVRANERVRMVNREVNGLRPAFLPNTYGYNPLIGKKVYCEIHSRGPDLLVVTARPA